MSSGVHDPVGSANGVMSSVAWPPFIGDCRVCGVVRVVVPEVGGLIACEPVSATRAA